jgi:hypothetical protein
LQLKNPIGFKIHQRMRGIFGAFYALSWLAATPLFAWNIESERDSITDETFIVLSSDNENGARLSFRCTGSDQPLKLIISGEKFDLIAASEITVADTKIRVDINDFVDTLVTWGGENGKLVFMTEDDSFDGPIGNVLLQLTKAEDRVGLQVANLITVKFSAKGASKQTKKFIEACGFGNLN